KGLTEVARAHALVVQPRDQLLDALGLAQVRWQDDAAELFPLAVRPAVVDPRLLHLHGPDARGDRPPRQRAVTHHLAMALLVPATLMAVDPVGHFRINRLREQL